MPAVSQKLHISSSSLYKMVSLIMIFSVAYKLLFTLLPSIFSPDLMDYGYSEFLINFEGGFVRRGLVGEILYWLTANFGIFPQHIIIIISLAAYAFVICFFFKQFKTKGYCWWLIFSPLLCGFALAIVRKDFLLFTGMIGMLYLVKAPSPALWRRLLATILGGAQLLVHEAFIFWGIPIFALILLADRRHILTNLLLILSLLAIFIISCIFKGDINIVNTINNSWNQILPGAPLQYTVTNSIGALGWDTFSTVISHIRANIGVKEGMAGICFWPLFWAATYYMLGFFFRAFSPVRSKYGPIEQTRLSALYVISTICMLPMFCALSCDYGRLFQYIAVSAFAAFLIVDPIIIDKIIPKWVNKFSARTNSLMEYLLPPQRRILVILLLLIGVSPATFNVTECFIQSPVGSLCQALPMTIYMIGKLFL